MTCGELAGDFSRESPNLAGLADIRSASGREARLAFAISTPARRERTKLRRLRSLPINVERVFALALNIGAWVVIWTVGKHLLGR